MAARRGWAVWLLAGLLGAGFVALGNWQLQRRVWKLELIARVEAGVQAQPVAPPSPASWPAIGRADEYRRLRLEGRYAPAGEVLVQAVTARGPGWWVLAPFTLADGDVVLVNRGFVDAAHREPATRAGAVTGDGSHTVIGLLRLSEPGGGFLRDNAPAAGRWHSRDVAAIGRALGLPQDRLAPYFVDAERAEGGPEPAWPVAGMTVLRFHNSHLVYALTWYTLAAMSGLGGWIVTRQRQR